MSDSLLGKATFESARDVVAGELGTWRFAFRVGRTGIAKGGCIRVYTDTDTDWGTPQFTDPGAEDYATFRGPTGSSCHVLVEGHRAFLIVNDGRALKSGEEIQLALGDRSRGGGGSRAQTFQEESRSFRVAVDLAGTDTFTELQDPPSVRVVGGEASKLVVLIPSLVELGESFDVLLKVEDSWGNPASAAGAVVDLAGGGVRLPITTHEFTEQDGGIVRLSGCTCAHEGEHRIDASLLGVSLQACSNPMLCVKKRAKHMLYWGDPHGGQLVEATKICEFFRFARDAAFLDFVGYQRNDHQLTNQDWAIQQSAERDFYAPFRFVPLPGYEWSGSTETGGHHNVYFKGHDRPIYRCRIGSSGDKSEQVLPHIRDVYSFYQNTDTILTPHVGGNHADLSFHDPSIEPAIEIASTHGTFEWFLRDSLERGYRMGVVGGSDGYTGRPGAEYPGRHDRRYAKGGLTAAWAESLTLEGIFDAIKARRSYATTGDRIYIEFSADGHMMGEEYATAAPPTFSFRVLGTAPIESVELFRGLERVAIFPKDVRSAEKRIRVTWQGASGEASYSGVVWDGTLRLYGTTIRDYRTLRFDSPRSSACLENQGSLRWHSVSCGYQAGIEIETADAVESARMELQVHTELHTRPQFGRPGTLSSVQTPLRRTSSATAEQVAATVQMADLISGPRTLDLGAPSRRIIVSLAPDPSLPSAISGDCLDAAIEVGSNPYWLRVTQQDLEMAWTSPVFVTFTSGEDTTDHSHARDSQECEEETIAGS